MATTYPATDSDLSYCFSTAVAAVGSASALGLRATVPVYPSSPQYRLHHRAAWCRCLRPARRAWTGERIAGLKVWPREARAKGGRRSFSTTVVDPGAHVCNGAPIYFYGMILARCHPKIEVVNRVQPLYFGI